ncbi:MAG: hypothetical protein LBG60_00995, partial [Bifidobacteriaceae bacterium]|nr:hypothetical protein [Bifidobacteriaceae bacterium]
MLTAETGLAGRPDRHHSPLPPRDRPSRAGRRTPGNPAETPPRLDGFDDLRVSCVSLAQLELGLRAAKDLATYRL